MNISLTKRFGRYHSAEIDHLGSLLDFKITMCIFFYYFFCSEKIILKQKVFKVYRKLFSELPFCM